MKALVGVLAVVLAAVLMSAGGGIRLPMASADPGTQVVAAPPDSGTTPPIAWTQLGRSDRIEILGSNQVVDTDIPVPQGIVPGLLTGQIGSVVDVADGRVDVLDGRGVLLGSIPVPADQGSIPFTVDISNAQVIDGTAKLSFVLRDRNPPGNSCTQPPSLTLGQLAATYLGQTPYPVLVSDFQPGYTDEILIRTGPTPSRAQQQAALDLVAQLTHQYRPMPVRIDVDTSADPAPPGSPTRRVIELRESMPAGLTVQNPGTPDALLVISGKGDDLERQVDVFSDRRIKLAQTQSATVMTATTDAPKATNIKTFAQLGMTGQISVLGTATLYVGFDVSQFGVGPIQEATLHLMGHYTPITGGEASLVVRSGSTVIASRRLDESGTVDINGTIPPESVQSNVGIALELRYLPSQQCAPLNDRIQFTLDPGSTVAVTPGMHNRGGFPVLPMAFTPDFDVALDQADHLRFAAEAINLLGQQTDALLHPKVTTLQSAAGGGRGLLAVARGDDLKRAGLDPPVLPEQGSAADINGTLNTDVDLNGPLGVIQAFAQGDRMVLAVNGTDDWSLVERSFDYIRSLDSRWASLTGDVVATGAASQTVNMTLREGGPLINEYPGDGWKWWAYVSAAAIAVALAAAAVIVIWRRRRRQIPLEQLPHVQVPHE